MEATEILAGKIIEDNFEKIGLQLSSVSKGKTKHTLLTKKTSQLGLLLINYKEKLEEDEEQNPYENIDESDEKYQAIKKLLTEKEWDDPDNYKLLVYLAGEERAKYIVYAWKQMPQEMYQTGYYRRSFRSPNNKDLYSLLQINFVIQALQPVSIYSYQDRKYSFYSLSLIEGIRYDHFISSNRASAKIFAAAIDLGNSEVLQVIEDIVFNKDEVGKVTSTIIKALLYTDKIEAWQLVEKLLLSAQRQEGLRQTIVEALDETSIGALKYMLKVIMDNNLIRFSSVVRALDVWAGLGWEAERANTIKSFLEKAVQYLESPDLIPEAIKSQNNTEVYMALWAMGVYDIEDTIPYLHELFDKGNSEKKCLALKFAIESHHYEVNMPLFYKALDSDDLQELSWAITGINEILNEEDKTYLSHPEFPDLFKKLHKIAETKKEKEQTFTGKVFSWMSVTFNRNYFLNAMISLVGDFPDRLDILLGYFDDMDINLRGNLTRIVLPRHSSYYYEEDKKDKDKPLTPLQRNFAFRLLTDRSESLVDSGYKALEKEAFTTEEMNGLPELLKRKGAGFRSKIIKLLLNQNDETLAPVADTLLLAGDSEQRMAGLDILLQLKKNKRLLQYLTTWVKAFELRKNVSQKEIILLDQLKEENSQDNFTEENGYGLYNPKNIAPIVVPAIDPNSFFEKNLKKNKYGFSMPFEKVVKALQKLEDLFFENKDYEYEVEYWDKSKATVLLANNFSRRTYGKTFDNPQEDFEDYPLPDLWEKWYQESGLKPLDLFIVHQARTPRYGDDLRKELDPLLPKYDDLMPAKFKEMDYNNPCPTIIAILMGIYPFEQKTEYLIAACKHLFASFTKEVLKYKQENTYYNRNYPTGWQADTEWNSLLHLINVDEVDKKDRKDFWNLYHWRQFSGLEENIHFSIPSLQVFCMAFEEGFIQEDDLYRGVITSDSIRELSSPKKNKNEYDYFEEYPFLTSVYERTREHFLDIELKRGDSPTQVTIFVQKMQTIFGIKRYMQILAGLGKTSLNKGYVYYWSDEPMNKQKLFSTLLKNCYPLETDTQKDFDEQLKKLQVKENRLIETAVYAPQWQKFVSTHLNWKGLDSAIWWMHAHTKTSGYQEQNAEAESEIARYSNVDLQDFKDGAVDKDWFLQAYKELGEERWQMLYDAAKYISDGNGHRRARIYADVMTGATKLSEVTEKVKSKRDQDYLRVYGLVPLNKSNKEKDVLARYEYLQQFKKETKQFGAQKQSSENLALRIAMENLARNAGYPDPIRLTWSMETKQVQNILSKETQIEIDGTLVGLIIDDEGQAEVVSYKGDKALKSIPAKLKKDSKVLELIEHRKTLKEQFKRSRRGLEEAMVRGDEFLLSEIENLFEHPVIFKHLEKLVFVSNGKHGFYREGKLISAKGQESTPSKTDTLRIAHCTDLNQTGEWTEYQTYCFDKEIKQPFKQIFRELYVPTEDELKEVSISRRYAGHQVQPSQTVALLKSRGWKVDYEEGLQKVFHQEGFAAKMYAMADWFSPAEVEAPTLETIEFRNLKTYKTVPFTEINPRIFSEVMRDIDLVVSVAHVGGVDPEASHSSVEMRTVLLKESIRLFKLNNVTLTESHAMIQGKLGQYSVHLGSAVVHQLPGRYISILPVHSQHRGRLFLPFVDDDPKSAELISKVLFLARDNEIQDPTVLRQLGLK